MKLFLHFFISSRDAYGKYKKIKRTKIRTGKKYYCFMQFKERLDSATLNLLLRQSNSPQISNASGINEIHQQPNDFKIAENMEYISATSTGNNIFMNKNTEVIKGEGESDIDNDTFDELSISDNSDVQINNDEVNEKIEHDHKTISSTLYDAAKCFLCINHVISILFNV